jgi:hypothetical protein
VPGRPFCSVAFRSATLNRLSLVQGGFNIGDGFEQIVGILLHCVNVLTACSGLMPSPA